MEKRKIFVYYSINMKILPALLFILILTFFNNNGFSQYSEEYFYKPIEYLVGDVNGKTLFKMEDILTRDEKMEYNRNNDDPPLKSSDDFNHSCLVTVEGNAVKKIFRYIEKDTLTLRWFVVSDRLYSVSSTYKNNQYILLLNEFDNHFKPVRHTHLFAEDIKKYGSSQITFKQDQHQIGIIGFSGITDTLGFSVVMDLNSASLCSKPFALSPKDKYTCTDFIWNNQLDLLAVFEGSQNSMLNSWEGSFTKRWKAFLVHQSPSTSEIIELKTKFDGYFLRSFKFLKLDDNKLILGGLLFPELLKSKPLSLAGYYKCSLTFDHISIENESKHIVAIETLDPVIWNSKKEKTLGDGNYRLKEIKQLEDKSLLFISERLSELSTPGGPGMGGYTGYGGMSPAVSSFQGSTPVDMGGYREGHYSMNVGDILITRLNNETIFWSSKPRMMRHRAVAKDTQNDPLIDPFYVLEQKSDTLVFYYSECRYLFDETTGYLLPKAPGRYSSTKSCLVKFELNVKTGKGDTKAVFSDFLERELEIISINKLLMVDNKRCILTEYRSSGNYKIHYKMTALEQ